MKHIYEIDSDRGIYWEVYEDNKFIMNVPSQDDLDFLTGLYYTDGVDFVIHELGGVEEYHYALPKH